LRKPANEVALVSASKAVLRPDRQHVKAFSLLREFQANGLVRDSCDYAGQQNKGMDL
jgi:hypothetical protein